MEFALVFVLTVGAVCVLREPLKRCPLAFYALAVIVVAIVVAGSTGILPGTWWKSFVLPVRRCMVALSLFAIVMLIGVLKRGGRLDSWLRPIRAELSILACIFCLGHMALYVFSYADRLLNGAVGMMGAAAFAVAFVLCVLLLLLGVTSFGFVKKRMKASTWKGLQRAAYPFFGLVYVHLLLLLAPAALNGGSQAVLSVALYTMVFAAYAILRSYRAFVDAKAIRQS